MGLEQQVWSLSDGKRLREVKAPSEKQIEDLLAANIEILDAGWLVIGRQVKTEGGGFIDILCIDQQGALVVVELKRELTPREVTAQALDYASCVSVFTEAQIAETYMAYSRKLGRPETLDKAYERKFGMEVVPMPVYKDDERGTWYASFYYTDWQGRRKLKKKRGFERKKDAQEFEREFLAKQERSCDMTFASLWALYCEDMTSRLRENTLQSKKYLVERHILPFYEALKVNEITPAHVRKWQSELLSKGYAQTYVKTINNQLVAVLNYAVRYYGLPSNPCHVAGSVGRKNADAMKFWTKEQFEAFLACVERPSARAGFSLLFWTGIRIGELLALTLNDFDFEKKTLSVSKSFQSIKGREVITEPKTQKSKRVIPLPDKLCAVVQEYTTRLYDYSSDERLFPFTKSFFHKEMEKACAASGVEKIRLHDLRHSHASLLIETGAPILLVSERLGHEDVETTLRTYGHLYPNKHEDTVKKLDDLMK